jgi:hypothetical protein
LSIIHEAILISIYFNVSVAVQTHKGLSVGGRPCLHCDYTVLSGYQYDVILVGVYDELTSFIWDAGIHHVFLSPGEPAALIVTFIVPVMIPSLSKIQIVGS